MLRALAAQIMPQLRRSRYRAAARKPVIHISFGKTKKPKDPVADGANIGVFLESVRFTDAF